MVERTARLGPAKRHLDVLPVGKANIRPAVTIVINQRDPAAHGLGNELFLRAGEMLKVNTDGSGNVHQLRVVRKRARGSVLCRRFFLLFPRKGSGGSHLRDR
jgi:hypothetical protein